MNYTIDQNAGISAYMQLYNQLVRDITTGIYPFGKKLPSKRTIAAEVGLSVITVEHALALLSDEGYVEARERSGYFVIYRESEFFSERKEPDARKAQEPLRIIRHQESVDSEFPYGVMAKTIRRVLMDYGEQILVKSPNHGCGELRQEICSYLARSRGILVKPSQVIVGSGAEYLYGLIAQLIGRHRKFAIEQPCYDKIPKVYAAMGITTDPLNLTADGIATSALEKTDATVLHVTPFNSFPSGISVSISKKKEYLRWAKEHNAILIEDNYDSELTVLKKAEDTLFSMAAGVRVLYVNTFSKTIAPSMRIGYLLLPEDMTDLFNERLGFYSCTVPLFEQYVLAELLRSGDFERHINRVRRKKRKLEQM
ncbi:MAG: PLP-dependent aminotransferase family protein [Lachnospiraceae bacterium]|nr:PLP-dependent aminotransferase family protein [Lachnospiraceae bacterium]